jgi:hypothetical protein
VKDSVEEMTVVVDPMTDQVKRSFHRVEEGMDVWTGGGDKDVRKWGGRERDEKGVPASRILTCRGKSVGWWAQRERAGESRKKEGSSYGHARLEEVGDLGQRGEVPDVSYRTRRRGEVLIVGAQRKGGEIDPRLPVGAVPERKEDETAVMSVNGVYPDGDGRVGLTPVALEVLPLLEQFLEVVASEDLC